MNRRRSRQCEAFFAATILLLCARAVRADDQAARTAADKVKAGNEFLANGKYSEALSAYDAAKTALPESAEVAYNRGIALYRLSEYEKAAQALQDALKPDKPELEAKAKYNLGRCAHESAISKREKLQEAINELSKAVSFYKDAIGLDVKDQDARQNLEQAERLRAFLEKKLQEQQQEKKKDSPSSQPSSQPKDEPTSQPQDKQQSSQPSSQPDKGEQQDQQQQGDQQKSDDQKQEQDQEEKGEQREQQDQEGKDSKSKQQEPKGDSKGQKEDEQAQSGEEGKEQEMRPEDADRLLQEARDAERARREVKRAKMMRLRGRTPVAKDW